MKLQKAIEIVQLNVRMRPRGMPADVLSALLLLIEAGKLVASTRGHSISPVPKLLPGETIGG